MLNGRKGKSVMGIIVMIANDITNSLTPCDKTLATCATGNVPFQVFWHSAVFVVLSVTVVFILPCVLWLPYASPIAVAVDLLFGEILRQNAKCPPSAHACTDTKTSRTSSLMLMLYENCQSPGRRTTLIITTLIFFCLVLLSFKKKTFP